MEKGELSNKFHVGIKIVSVGLHYDVRNFTDLFIKKASGPKMSCEIVTDSLLEKIAGATVYG